MIRQLEQVTMVFRSSYIFTDTTVWAEYEAIQSDIFDHLLAVIPEFELAPFQNSTGKESVSGTLDVTMVNS